MRKINDEKLLEMLKQNVSQKALAKKFKCSIPAISKRISYLKRTREPESFDQLTDRQKKFAEEIVGGASQTQAAITAYDVSSLDSAKNIGSRLMKEPSMKMAVRDLLDYHGQTRSHRIDRLGKWIDSRDAPASLKGLEISFRLDRSFDEEITQEESNPKEIMEGLIKEREKLDSSMDMGKELILAMRQNIQYKELLNKNFLLIDFLIEKLKKLNVDTSTIEKDFDSQILAISN